MLNLLPAGRMVTSPCRAMVGPTQSMYWGKSTISAALMSPAGSILTHLRWLPAMMEAGSESAIV